MTEARTSIPLTVPEYSLIIGLRDITDSELKSRILAVIDGLVRLGSEPRCAGAQADGVPCGCPQSQCESCGSAFERVQSLVNQGFPPRLA